MLWREKGARVRICCTEVFQVCAGLTNVLCWSRCDIDSLNPARLDYICSSKLFSGLSQRQPMVENVDNRGGKKKKHYLGAATR